NFVRARETVDDSLHAAGFGANFHFAARGFDYFAQSEPPSPLLHYWSLSVEEQFYLLWPFALLVGYRRNPRLFTALTVSLIGITLALNLYLGLSRAVIFDPHEYDGTDTNALPILVGAMLAIVVHNGWRTRGLRQLAPTAPLALGLLIVLAYRNDTERTALVTVAGTAFTFLMIVGVVALPHSVYGSVMASRPMQWLGERSYSIYLWNILARIAILNTLGRTVIGDVVWIAMFLVLAEASYRYVEHPLRLKYAQRPGAAVPAAVEA
ncbi:MAG TPA: acyltransferase, partial [Micromonosporaceae bacterium]